MTANQCFILDPEDYVKGSNLGEITAIIHSHPTALPNPSDADLVSCENSGLPWHIVNPHTETWGYCEPTGYKAPLLGRNWVWGITDCWSLVRDWYKQEKNIDLIDYQRPIDPEEFLKKLHYLKNMQKDTGFRELECK